MHNRLSAMIWTPIPDEKTRVEYIARVIDMFAEEGISLTVEEANLSAERLYHLDHDQWLDVCKE